MALSIKEAILSVLGNEPRPILRVVVTGSRKWFDFDLPREALEACWALTQELLMVGHGAANGLDYVAERILVQDLAHRGLVALIVSPYHAKWDLYGTAAGGIRNQEMLDAEEPDIVLAFPLPESVGTWNCVNHARSRGIPVVVIYPEGYVEVFRPT